LRPKKIFLGRCPKDPKKSIRISLVINIFVNAILMQLLKTFVLGKSGKLK